MNSGNKFAIFEYIGHYDRDIIMKIIERYAFRQSIKIYMGPDTLGDNFQILVEKIFYQKIREGE